MRTRYGSCTRLPGLVFLLVAIPAAAAEPTAGELIARAPVLRSDDPAIRSIALSGYSRNDQGRLQFAFRAFYRAPDRFALAQFDGLDGTPIAYLADRKALVYDPVGPELRVFDGLRLHMELDVKEGKFHFVQGADFDRAEAESIVVDLKALFAPGAGDEQPADARVLKAGDGRSILVRRFHEAYRRSRIDLTLPQPFLTFETAMSPTAEPNFCISSIVVNGEVDDEAFRFPEVGRIATGLPVSETVAEDGLGLGAAGALFAWPRVLYVRTHQHESPLSRGLLAPAMMGVRWGRVARSDAAHAAAVRALVPIAAEPRDYQRSMKTDDPDAIRRTGFEEVKRRLPSLPIMFKIKIKTGGDAKDD